MCTAPDPLTPALSGRRGLHGRHFPRHRRRGLTLLETVAGLAILALLSGAVFAIVSGAVEATADLAATQTSDRRVETFLHRTRQALAHLPEGATLELRVLENEPLRQEFILRNVPEAYIWGIGSRWDKPVITLSARECDPEADGLPDRGILSTPPAAGPGNSSGSGSGDRDPANPKQFSLAMSVPDFFRTDDEGEPLPESPVRSRQGHQYLKPDQQGRFWMDLLPEVARVEWRFWQPARNLWTEQSPPARPPLVEMLLFLPGRTSPVRSVFSTG